MPNSERYDRRMHEKLKSPTLIFFSFAVTAFTLFGISLSYPFFVFDDSTHITNNIKMGQLSWENLSWYWQHSKTPLIFNFWQLISFFFGTESATPFRFFSIVIHTLNSFLVFIWLKKILTYCLPKDELQNNFSHYHLSALLGALFFLIHPIHTEVIVWVSSLKDSLTFLGAILSFLFYLKAHSKPNDEIKFLIISFFFFLIALLVKPSVLPLVIVYIWLDITLFSIPFSKILPRYFHFLILGSIVAFMHLKVLQNTGNHLSLLGKSLMAFDAIRLTLFNMLFPFDLRFDYQRTFSIISYQISNLFSYQLSIILVGIFIYVSFISLYKEKWKPFHYSMGIFIILLSINMGFIPFMFQNISNVADRYAYLPSLGFSLFFSWISWHLFKRFSNIKQALIIPLSILLVFSILSMKQTRDWKLSSTLIKKSVENTYLSFAAMISLGVALDSEGHPREAIEYFKTAKKLSPENMEANEHLFSSYINANLLDEAAKVLLEMTNKKMAKTSSHVFVDIARFYLESDEVFKAEDAILKLEELAKLEGSELLFASAKTLRQKIKRKKDEKIYRSLWLIGNLKLERGQKKEGFELLKKAQILNPSGRYETQIQALLKKQLP